MEPPAQCTAQPQWRSSLRTSLLIGIGCLLVYNLNMRAISAGDTYPARYLPFAILQYHTVFLDPVATVTAQGRGDTAFWMVPRPNGHILSLYPIVAPVLVAPLYVPAVGYLHLRGWTEARLDHVARIMEKLSASFVAALSAALLYLVLRRRTTSGTALLLTVAYAFGTTTWVISSQALWQHGMAQLFLIAALLVVTARCTAPRSLALGVLCGLLVCNRPPDGILAAALGAYGLFWAGPRRIWVLFAGSALATAPVLFYNLRFMGHIAGGYGLPARPNFFHHDLLQGAAGLLVSPTRGLLIYSPFLLFAGLALLHRPRDRGERLLTLALTAGVVIQFLLYAKADWRGGLSWGPRHLSDILPMLIWLMVPAVAALRGIGRVCFVMAVAVSIAIEAIGAFAYSSWMDTSIYATPEGEHELDATWEWRNAALLACLREGFAPRELWEARGSFAAIQVAGETTTEVAAGDEVIATGWALAGHATPWQVAILIDGRDVVLTRTFHDRSDVRAAMNEASPAGWSIALDPSPMAAGVHQLAVLVWGADKGEPHYLGERTLTVRAEPAASVLTPPREPDVLADARSSTGPQNLEASFAQAATRIREHQQAPGYWLTSFTSGTRFHQPHPEMNTFLTAVMIDLLDPLPKKIGLERNVQHARRHLTSQIEANGLVRYHGLPDGPGIGTLGCAITPDTDDTALVWRVAPARDRAKLTSALAIIDRYRTREGLYRTWLAQPDAYQCLNPGADPNPADVVIQMHLLLLLKEARPAGSRALCEALRPLIDDDRIWVYYEKAPLIPILRRDDLRRAGCDLPLPDTRMRSGVAGQELWVSAARWLSSSGSRDPVPDRARIRAVLGELAQNDFAYLRANPPLLYHNDLTASVSRYYWSEDVGYALWLRLYEKYESHGRPSRDG